MPKSIVKQVFEMTCLEYSSESMARKFLSKSIRSRSADDDGGGWNCDTLSGIVLSWTNPSGWHSSKAVKLIFETEFMLDCIKSDSMYLVRVHSNSNQIIRVTRLFSVAYLNNSKYVEKNELCYNNDKVYNWK